MRLHLFSVVFCSIIVQQTSTAQKTWSKELLEKANTAMDASYLTEEEKAVIFYSNLVRLKPQLFKETYLKHYLDSTHAHSSYVKSLLKTLENTPELQELYPSKNLYAIAKEHATEFGKHGKTGHGNFTKRFDKYMRNCGCAVAENCYYGNISPLNITIELLIDEGINDLSHRKNLLNPIYQKTGVSISPHKVYKKSCVMDFSSAASDD
jgi:uncharacterized protein YkwD